MKLIFGLLIISTCAMAQQAPLHGVWLVDWQATLQHMAPEELSAFQQLPPDIQTQVQAGIMSKTFTFNLSGVVTISTGAAAARISRNGQWQWTTSDIIEISIGADARQYQVLSQTDDLIVWRVVDKPESMLLSTLAIKRN